MRVAWYDSPHFDNHRPFAGHVERPERLHRIRERLVGSSASRALVQVAASPIDRELLESLHHPGYVQRVEALCRAGGGALDPDTSVAPGSWDAARRAAGAVVEAVEQVMRGTFHRAFCSVRPPGHHAVAQRAMGFCLFDNVALGAEAARRAGAERVAIVDWDVHHGNGTQDLFYERGDVFFASTHQYPFYPGTGAADETGWGEGAGTTLNCPLPAGSGDGELLGAWRERILPALTAFQPDLLLVSAGFDADGRDPLGGLAVTPSGFETLSAEVVAWAEAHCQGRVVSVLEGGYDLEALAEDVSLHVDTLIA